MKSKNLIDYVKTEFRSIDAWPFNPVDSLVLSQFSYVHFADLLPGVEENADPVRLGSLLRAERFDELFHEVRDVERNQALLFALAASPRFRDLRMTFYVHELDAQAEKQFAAVTFLLPDGRAYLAFRGTDSTFVGWKEDFNMAFISPIPSQEEAVQYVARVASALNNRLILGGHSKGGNLAVYAGMACEAALQDRIDWVFSHDGPGFKDDVFRQDGYRRISDRIRKTLPQSSIIGMLLENQEDYAVVRSSRVGVMQHDPFSWQVAEDDFELEEQLSSGARYMNATLRDWIATMSDEDRARFSDTLFGAFTVGGATTVDEFMRDWRKNVPAILTLLGNMDAETRGSLSQTLKAFFSVALHNITHEVCAINPLEEALPDERPSKLQALKASLHPAPHPPLTP